MRGQTSVPAISPFMRRPTSFAVAPDGTLYWTDNEDSAIYRLKGDMVELVAGGTAKSTGDSGDGGPALEAKFNHPLGLAFDKAGNLYVADTGNLRVRKIDAQGTITTYAGLPMAQLLPKLIGGAQASEEGIQASKAALIGPAALCFDAQGNLYLTEAGTANIAALGAAEQSLPIPIELLPKVPARIRKIAPDGTITTVAGPGTKLLNDPNSDNTLKVPLAMIIDGQGRLIIADTGLNQVKLLPKGSF
jgi:sugar lactone lactonase YvrE